MTEAFICDAVRTPIGKLGGSLSTVRADDLAALPLRALIERNTFLILIDARHNGLFQCPARRDVLVARLRRS
jgi:acetyl-CoA acetyltransferase